jgi:glycosyltransferase involved in cell wall biosynthesis
VQPRVAILPPVPAPYREPLFRALAERGVVEPWVVYLAGRQEGWDQPLEWFDRREGYRSEVLRSRQWVRAGRSPITVARGLGTALDRIDPACVVSWEYGPATWRALAWCRRRRRPLLIFSEVTPWTEAALSRLQSLVHRLLTPRVDGFIAASSQSAERLARLGVDRASVEVALQSADLEPLLGLEHRGTGAGQPLRVLVMGRLVPDKNLPLLLDAFAEAGVGEEAELVLQGGGPMEAELKDQAARLGVRAHVKGPVAPRDLPAAYAPADVLALVSTYEPFGVTMREGAAAALPLLCTERAGAVGDVAVGDENALLVNPDSRAEIVAALRRLVREPDLRERLAAGSRAVTERHPLSADAEAWERGVLRVVG